MKTWRFFFFFPLACIKINGEHRHELEMDDDIGAWRRNDRQKLVRSLIVILITWYTTRERSWEGVASGVNPGAKDDN